MEQLSFFDTPQWPSTCEDVADLCRRFVLEGETDEDALTVNELAKGYSFFVFGAKILEFYPGANGKPARLKAMLPKGKKTDERKAVALAPNDLTSALCGLRDYKRHTFRNLITDTFACCNSFDQCSDARHCLHQDDRFYNGCLYRTQLENGRVYFGSNPTV